MAAIPPTVTIEVERGPVCRLALDVLVLVKDVLRGLPVPANDPAEVARRWRLWERADALATLARDTCAVVDDGTPPTNQPGDLK